MLKNHTPEILFLAFLLFVALTFISTAAQFVTGIFVFFILAGLAVGTLFIKFGYKRL